MRSERDDPCLAYGECLLNVNCLCLQRAEGYRPGTIYFNRINFQIVKLFPTFQVKNNTLLASFSLADGTFGVAASTVVTTLIIKTGLPHFKKSKNGEFIVDSNGRKIPNEKTFLMYCKDDGYKILKNTRVEKKKGLGEEKINSWLNDYQKKNEDPLKSVYEYVYEEDEWLIEE